MSQVDPFIIVWPDKWVSDPEVQPAVEYLNRFLHDLWVRTGAGNDDVADAGLRELYPWTRGRREPQQTFPWRSRTKPQELYYSEQSTNYTATDFEYINASSGITVDLPQYPVENSIVYVRNSDGSNITLDGNGKNISYRTSTPTKRTVRKGTILQAVYLVDSDEWVL